MESEGPKQMCANSFPPGLLRENLPPLVQPTHGEITSFIYHFLALFFQQIPGWGAISQERNPPSVCVCECVSTTVIPLCKNADRAPSLSGTTAQILFLPRRNVSQYLGIYGPPVLAGRRLVCIPRGPSQSLHEPPAFESGGSGTGHAETQVFRLHYNSN